MSQVQLAALEREVEQARSRFAHDLTRLRSPATFSAFKDELVAEKDELVDKAKSAAKDAAKRVFDDLKAKAVANPAATLAIGAGLAWRIARHPPVASLLVGIGLVSLLRTSASQDSQPYMDLYDEDPEARFRDKGLVSRASELAESVKEKVQAWTADAGGAAREAGAATRETVTQLTDKAQEWTAEASEAARDAVAQVTDKAASLTDKAASMADRASGTARQAATRISDKAAVITDKASTALRDVIPEQEARDRLLLGTAALAVAAAVGIAYQRRHQEERQLELVD
jgi:hypothetical protein